MTSEVNEPGDQEVDLAKTVPGRQTVAASIDSYLVDGMPVLDQNGEKVGVVKLHSSAAGYLMVEHGAFERTYLYIPFRLIRTIDPDEIFVAETKDILASQYTQPPTITTVVETRLVPGPNGAMTQQTYPVQVVQSGYDDIPTPVNNVDVDSIASQLAVGMVVYDVTGERLGDLTQYDVSRQLLMVEKGILRPRALVVPFSAIAHIHPGMFTVYLSMPADVLLKEHAMLPKEA